MSKVQSRGAARRAARQQQRQRAQQIGRWWPILAVAGVAVAAVMVLIRLGLPSGDTLPVENVMTSSRIKGDPAAPVQIDEWGDFQCPVCRQFTEGVERELTKAYLSTGQVKLVWHNLAFLGSESLSAAEAAECANDQGQFWAYHDKLYAQQSGENRGTFKPDALKRFASQLGLQTDTFNLCLDQGTHADQIRTEVADGQAKGVRATPTFFIGSQKIEGPPTFDRLKTLLIPLLPSPGQGAQP